MFMLSSCMCILSSVCESCQMTDFQPPTYISAFTRKRAQGLELIINLQAQQTVSGDTRGGLNRIESVRCTQQLRQAI